MKKSLFRQAAAVAAVLCTGAVTMLAAAPAAHAVPYTGNDIAVTAMGSDTIQNVMGTYLANFDGSTTVLPGKTVHTYNVPAFPSPNYVTRGDADCAQDISWVQTGGTGFGTALQNAPSGSGGGKTYAVSQEGQAANQKGCGDIFRSSATPGSLTGNPTQEKATMEYYAFALDAVTWASSSLKAPATLTRQQVQDIYACNITNWDQVGGTTGAIQRYLPQSASGTRSFFLGQYGITAAMLATTNANCPAVLDNSVINPAGGANIKFEENQGATIQAADYDKAILPYSAGVWSYQAANSVNPTIDVRNGVRLGGLTTVTGPVKGNPVEWSQFDRAYQLNFSPGGVVNESNVALANPAFSTTNGYVGVRYVFNILDNAGNLAGYQAGFNMLGFQNVAAGTKSPMCSNDGLSSDQQFARAAVLSFGFAPLDTTNPSSNGSNVAGATCRKYAPTP